MTSPAALEQETRSNESGVLWDGASRHRLVAGLASGFLLWASFPPIEWSWIAWVALAPLFWLATLSGFRLRTYLAAWVGGLVFWLFALEWVRLCDPRALPGWILLAVVFSLWWPGFLALAHWSIVRLKLPLILVAPIIWVGGEFVRAHFLSGLPWYYLAHSQFRHLYLIQIADLTGSLGISFLIAVFNALVVDLVSRPLFQRTRTGTRLARRQHLRLCFVTVLLGTTACYGAVRISNSSFRDGPRLALLQSNFERGEKLKTDPSKTIARFEALIDRAIASDQLPDLIVWPETAYPFGFIAVDSKTDPRVLEGQVRSIAPTSTVERWLKGKNLIEDELHDWTDRVKVPMLVGCSYYDHRPESFAMYNSAILFRPGVAETVFYHKMHLVPFGEYVPFVDAMPWLSILDPYRGGKLPRLSFGREPRLVPLGEYFIAVTICFEDTIPQVINRFFTEAAGDRQPDLLVNLTNDGWFKGSAELDMHLAIGVFRAIEHRVPLARAVNTGFSALVDGNGEIRAFLPKDTEDTLAVTVPLDGRYSFYSRFGDWLGLSCLAVTIGLLPLGLIHHPRKSPRQV
jgi:apolipoprotein N-acyltransferase